MLIPPGFKSGLQWIVPSGLRNSCDAIVELACYIGKPDRHRQLYAARDRSASTSRSALPLTLTTLSKEHHI